jgi:hypothetical protein
MRGTYGCVVDEAGRFGVGVFRGVRVVGIVRVVGVVLVVAIVIPVIRILRCGKFGGWDLDVEGGEGLAETGESGNGADVGLES